MNKSLNKAAHCYIAYIENNPVAFFGVLHLPHPKVKNMKKGHRLVVLPDYQGIGIGHAFSTAIAEHYKQNGFRFVTTNSTKSLFIQRNRDKRWIVTRKGRMSGLSEAGRVHSKSRANETSINKLTYSYEYIGERS